MYSTPLTILGFIAGSPLVHAAMMGGYVKSMLQNEAAVTQNEVPMDPRLYSIWSSFHKIYQEVEHAATATTSNYPVPTSDIHGLPTSGQYYTVASSETYQPTPTPTPTDEMTLYSTVTFSVSSCSGVCPSFVVPPPLPATTSSAVETNAVVSVSNTAQPSQNTTASTSTKKSTTTSTSTSTTGASSPTKVPPPLNAVSKNAAPVMGAVAFVIAACFLF
ncbi:hypothetical protein V8C37DRAFT_366410 [Trichoderma ceciliae]